MKSRSEPHNGLQKEHSKQREEYEQSLLGKAAWSKGVRKEVRK